VWLRVNPQHYHNALNLQTHARKDAAHSESAYIHQEWTGCTQTHTHTHTHRDRQTKLKTVYPPVSLRSLADITTVEKMFSIENPSQTNRIAPVTCSHLANGTYRQTNGLQHCFVPHCKAEWNKLLADSLVCLKIKDNWINAIDINNIM